LSTIGSEEILFMKKVMPPKISIITVCFNAENAIETTIKNVLTLEYSNLDYIIIDGGSQDGTVRIIKNYSGNIKYWISEPDKGIYDAMNKGWQQADINSHILFLGAGDAIIQLPADTDLRTDCIYFGEVTIGDHRVFKSKLDFRLKIGNTMHHQALLIPKKLHPQPPFNIAYKVYADFDFNQRLLKSKASFIHTSQLKSYAMPGGISDDFKTIEWYYIIKNNFGPLYAILGYMYRRFQIIRKGVLGR
jgi:glycosyltransferase involved in cell wall biosynthesis